MNVAVFITFSMVFIANLFSENNRSIKGQYFTKPLLMPLLLLFYSLTAKNLQILIVLALVCGFFGDLFLMWAHKHNFFIAGIVSFLMGHILYSITFLQTTDFLHVVPLWFYIFLVPYFIYILAAYINLHPYLNSMKIPSVFYMIGICLMSFTCLTRIWSTTIYCFLLPFLGSVFFIVSDSLLALNIFTENSKYKGIYIMTTYVLAQALIVFGYINL